MKKVYIAVTTLLLIAGTFVLTSCNKDAEITHDTMLSKYHDYPEEKSEQMDTIIHQYSKVIAVAMTNPKFRNIVKEQALLQFDGDYDVLSTKLHNLLLDNTNTVRSFLEKIVDERFATEFRTNGTEFINIISAEIPNLQVSVPVHCEEWDPSLFTPRIVPFYSTFDDHKNTKILSYDENWTPVAVSLEEDPDIPYVVVGISERVDRSGQLIYSVYTDKSTDTGNTHIVAPSNLVVNYGNGANELLLEWGDVSNESGYQIYRYSANTGLQLLTTTDENVNVYVDNTVEAGKKYTYTVRSIDNHGNPSWFSSTKSWYGSEREPGVMLKIGGLKFDDKYCLRNYESWVSGKPEIVLNIYTGKKYNDTTKIKSIKYIMPQPKRSDIKGTWWNCDIDIHKWDPDKDGQMWSFAWSEKDCVENFEFTMSVTATYKDTIGNYTINVSPDVKFKITKDGDMGSTIVNYWDKKDHEYSLGTGFNFKFKN